MLGISYEHRPCSLSSLQTPVNVCVCVLFYFLPLSLFLYIRMNISGYLNHGYSTPFLSLGSSYMYSSLAAAKAAVISVGEEIATMGLPAGICPLVFVFTGAGNGK